MEGLGQRMRGAIREDTGMPEQEKLSLVSDQDDPRVEGKPKREGEDAKADTSTIQTPIQRHGDDPPHTKREVEQPVPTPSEIVDPIKRPDPNPDPIVPQKPGRERGEGR